MPVKGSIFFALDTFLLPQVICDIDSGPGFDLYIYYVYIRVFRIFPPGPAAAPASTVTSRRAFAGTY